MRINDLLHMDNVDAVNEHIRSLTPTAAYYPGGLLGFDREGNLVAGQQMGRSHPKELWKCGPFSDMYRQCIVEAALIYQAFFWLYLILSKILKYAWEVYKTV
jgi:hypothetical protein